ncbi:MAG: hypothetical protein E7Z87_07830 [Cyanobacteria bacterium SIG26]|nr:hypothetical protein [Cyanobacteria bacterium SIG26]
MRLLSDRLEDELIKLNTLQTTMKYTFDGYAEENPNIYFLQDLHELILAKTNDLMLVVDEVLLKLYEQNL